MFQIYVEGFLKTMIYCGLLFSSLDNHHHIKEYVGDGNENVKRES
jgi:hypothetical protein